MFVLNCIFLSVCEMKLTTTTPREAMLLKLQPIKNMRFNLFMDGNGLHVEACH